jgi:glycosyltransferase involved in cell wall biosynthesis
VRQLQAVAVVIPAHDERELLAACLDAVAVAAAGLDLPVTVVAVLDACTDGTEEVLVGRDVVAVTTSRRSVGAARAAGAAAVLSSRSDLAGLWMACTDADTVVGDDWLLEQVRMANGGADLVLGTVRLSPDHEPRRLVAAWAGGYDARDGHRHVHGANLGVRASTYVRAGGFAAVPVDEDVRLVAAVLADPAACVVRTSRMPVVTSGRLVARAPGGFAGHLRGLDARAS